MTTYLTYDRDSKVIWGSGDSPEASLADARDWHSRNGDPDEQWSELSERLERLETEPATEGLAAAVEACGGQVSWTWSGTADDRVMCES